MSAVWERRVDASPGRVFRALGSVTVDDLGAGRLVAAVRRRRRFEGEPLYAQALAHGLRVQSSDPLRRVVLRRRPYRATIDFAAGTLRLELAGPGARALRPALGAVVAPWLEAVERRAVGRRSDGEQGSHRQEGRM